MKKIKTTIIAFAAIMISVGVQAQSDTVKIMTSAVCDLCKERIENVLSFEKGVKSGILDLETKIVTVVYNPEKTTDQKIREAITKMGYDADSLAADAKAYKRLPDCCKHDGMKH